MERISRILQALEARQEKPARERGLESDVLAFARKRGKPLEREAAGLDLGEAALLLEHVGVDEFRDLPDAGQQLGRRSGFAGAVGSCNEEKSRHQECNDAASTAVDARCREL